MEGVHFMDVESVDRGMIQGWRYRDVNNARGHKVKAKAGGHKAKARGHKALALTKRS